MNKNLTIALIALLIIVVGLATLRIVDSSVQYTKDPTASQQESIKKTEQTATIQYRGEDGKTALELLHENANVQMHGEGEMAFVTTINGESADDTEFWAYLVNNKMANVGAGSYRTSSSDTITWELQTIDSSFSESSEESVQ